MKKQKIITKNSNNQKIVGELYIPDNTKNYPIAIYVHGFRSDRNSSKIEPIAKALSNLKIGLFAFDFTGRGESDGRFENTTITQYIDDLNCVINKILKITNNIILIGNSLGGIVSLNSNLEKISSMILLSPVSYFPYRNSKEFSAKSVKEWKNQGYIYTQSKRFGKMKLNYDFYQDSINYNSYTLYKKITIPTLIIHGQDDSSVPYSQSIKLSESIKSSKLILIPNCDHNYKTDNHFKFVINKIVDFINSLKIE